jgi:IS5 family transposase
MFKILLLQQWYGLSDQEAESAMLDRISFIRFVGLSVEDSVPDHATICRFRNSLVEKKILHSLLDEVNSQMEKQGKLVKKGVAVDATVIASAARPRKQVDIESITCDRQEGEQDTKKAPTVRYSHDSDATWTKKGKDFHYGYKAHTSVDIETGIVLSAHVTPANFSDTGELQTLVEASQLPPKSRVFADKGYTSAGNSLLLKQSQCKNGIMNRAYRNTPLTKRERTRNKLISQKRYIVERIFATLKQHYKMARAHYLGILKVQGEFLLSSLAYNLKRSLFLVSARDSCVQCPVKKDNSAKNEQNLTK